MTNPAYAYEPLSPYHGAITTAATYTNNGAILPFPGGKIPHSNFDVEWMLWTITRPVLLSGPINIAVIQFRRHSGRFVSTDRGAGHPTPTILTQPTCAPGTASTTWTGSAYESMGKVQWTLNLPAGNLHRIAWSRAKPTSRVTTPRHLQFLRGVPRFTASAGPAQAQLITFIPSRNQWAGATGRSNGKRP